MSETKQLEGLFEEAKCHLYAPAVPNELVGLDHIIFAMERSFGAHTPIFEYLLKALVDTKLIARTLEDDILIPVSEWRSYLEKDVPASEVGFVFGGFDRIFHEDPFLRDCTPVVAKEDAIRWLLSESERHRKSQRLDTNELKSKFSEWVSEFEQPSKPTQAERQEWFRRYGVSRDRGRELEKELAPDYWKRPGRTTG